MESPCKMWCCPILSVVIYAFIAAFSLVAVGEEKKENWMCNVVLGIYKYAINVMWIQNLYQHFDVIVGYVQWVP